MFREVLNLMFTRSRTCQISIYTESSCIWPPTFNQRFLYWSICRPVSFCRAQIRVPGSG